MDPIFQGVNRLFVSSFGNNTDGIVHTACYIPKVEIKDWNIITDASISEHMK